jgi:hypothetical protein
MTETIILFKGMADYDGGDILPPIERGSELRDPCPAEECIQEWLRNGSTLESLVIRHANYSMGWSPGVTFTKSLEVAEEFASRLGREAGKMGVIIEVELPISQVWSIRDLVSKGWGPGGLNLSLDQVLKEQEYIILGRISANCVRRVIKLEDRQVLR